MMLKITVNSQDQKTNRLAYMGHLITCFSYLRISRKSTHDIFSNFAETNYTINLGKGSH